MGILSLKYIAPKLSSTPDDSVKYIIYTGPSMNPTLKSLDRLQVIPYNCRKIRRGDVIVFIHPEGKHKVIHRVISVELQGIRTQGDNNNNIDLHLISPNKVIGQIVYAYRGSKRLYIYGGPLGQLFILIVRVIRKIERRVSALLRPIYHWLSQLGIFKRWTPVFLKTQILSFNRPAGTELQLLMGNRVIGRRLAGKNQWWIKRPYRLFVDESSLP